MSVKFLSFPELSQSGESNLVLTRWNVNVDQLDPFNPHADDLHPETGGGAPKSMANSFMHQEGNTTVVSVSIDGTLAGRANLIVTFETFRSSFTGEVTPFIRTHRQVL